ncbi:MAG: peptidoglycan editing factor PgeF [Deltaproteobacteria bacterium]
MKNTKFELKHTGRWSYYYVPGLEQRGIKHGFFTAQSPSHALQGNDKAEFLGAFGLNDFVIMKQEHGVDIHVIQDGYRPISGDGLIIISKGIAGIVKTADCLPVILCGMDRPAVSIIHAGWRGTANKITKKAIDKMSGLGVNRKRITAILGPSIGPCCYEVKNDVRNVFTEEGFSDNIFKRKNDILFLDIRQANMEILNNEGIEDIYDIDLCTQCSRDIFNSYRGGEKEKRQINFVSLTG